MRYLDMTHMMLILILVIGINTLSGIVKRL